jgi:hypothetical protein
MDLCWMNPVIARSRLKCLEAPTELGHNPGHNHLWVVTQSRKCLILKWRDVRVVEGARLESAALERRGDVPKHLFR